MRSANLKTALEASVWNEPSSSTRKQRDPGRVSPAAGWAHLGLAIVLTRNDVWPELPGVELSTYRIMGLSFEHGNLDPSAGSAKPGKLPSPAMSRTGGRASVVVGARESRVRGEGRQR